MGYFMQFTTLDKWKHQDEILAPYSDYETVCIGIQWVDTIRIVGLSLWTPEKVANDSKMLQLIQSVRENGWNDRVPQDFHLYKVPTGEYTVASGGNHRPVLASELGIPQIQASVDVLMPTHEIDSGAIERIQSKNKQIEWAEHEARELVLFLRAKEIYSECEAEKRRYDEIFDEIGKLYEERREILITEAIRLGYMTEEERIQSTI